VTLDSRTLKTPAKNTLALPTACLAHGISVEWDYQASHIEPNSMPLMILASTALDQVATDFDYVRENCLKYLHNDTTCYFADAKDERILRRKQKAAWDPVHEFVAREEVLGAAPYVSDGELLLGNLKHPEAMVSRARELVWGYDVWQLTALQSITMEAKSLLVGIAVLEGFLSADAAVVASRIEEEFQVEQWGLVEGGHDMDQLNNDVQIRAAKVMLDMLECP